MRATGDYISGEPGAPARSSHCVGETSVTPSYNLIPCEANKSLAVRALQLKARQASRKQTLRQRRSGEDCQSSRGVAPSANTQLRANGDAVRSTPSETCKTT